MTVQRVNLDSNQFQPKQEYVLVKPEALIKEKETESGIVIQLQKQHSVERPTYGEVVAVGNSIDDITEGMFIMWPETDGLDIEFNDGEFLLLRYKSIIGMKK